jgi:hypothetical protein
VRSCLFGSDDLVFDVVVVVLSPASGTQAVHVILDVVVTELTYLTSYMLARGPVPAFFK